jgi:hypothetical protein
MDDLIGKLTAEQAQRILMRLSDREGPIREAVLAEARVVLKQIDLEEVACEAFDALDSIDVHDCWDRAGSSREGYTSPEDAAVELLEEALQPFVNQVGRYCDLGLSKEETVQCMGTILGLYRYEQESRSEFREWSVDIPVECAGDLLAQWRKRRRDSASSTAMDEFIQDRCPNWAGSLLRT